MKIKNAFAANFGHRLKVARIQKKLYQHELCEMTGITQKHMSELENGWKSPSLEVAARLSKALGVTLEELILEN